MFYSFYKYNVIMIFIACKEVFLYTNTFLIRKKRRVSG